MYASGHVHMFSCFDGDNADDERLGKHVAPLRLYASSEPHRTDAGRPSSFNNKLSSPQTCALVNPVVGSQYPVVWRPHRLVTGARFAPLSQASTGSAFCSPVDRWITVMIRSSFLPLPRMPQFYCLAPCSSSQIPSCHGIQPSTPTQAVLVYIPRAPAQCPVRYQNPRPSPLVIAEARP